MKILTAEQTRLAENIAIKSGISGERLMENAGAAATRVVKEHFNIDKKRIIIVAGQGNNGGDGFVVARKLKEYGARVSVLLTMGIAVTQDSSLMLNRAVQAGVTILNYYDDINLSNNLIGSADLIIDAIFGIGFHGAPDRELSVIIDCINKSSAKVISLDLPSGVCCNDGQVHGSAVKAELTVSFIGYKPCHFISPASAHCGEVVSVSIGIDDENIKDYFAEVTDIKKALDSLKPIPRDAHKGTKGTAVIFGGSFGMAGAPMLSARSALRSGAGMVKVCLPESVYSVAAAYLPEAVFAPLNESNGKFSADAFSNDLLKKADSVLLGPGMGMSDGTVSLTAKLILSAKVPVVIDADGLNALALEPEILKSATANIIVTPHPGEMARLLKKTVEEIQNSRIASAIEFANSYGVITVLKGAYTVIASPNGKLYINTTGNNALATAGSGDMLAGIITAFLANGMEPLKAAVSAVCLHGAVGDLTAFELGGRGVITSDMIERLPLIFK